MVSNTLRRGPSQDTPYVPRRVRRSGLQDFTNRLTAELGVIPSVSFAWFAYRLSYDSQFTVMFAVNFSFLTAPGVVTPCTTANAIRITIITQWFHAVLQVYSDPGLVVAVLQYVFMADANSCRSPLPS
jgi:hypothetical protein